MAQSNITLPGDHPLTAIARANYYKAEEQLDVAGGKLAQTRLALENAEARAAKSTDETAIPEKLVAAVAAAESGVRVAQRRLDDAERVYTQSLADANAAASAEYVATLAEIARAYGKTCGKALALQAEYLELREEARRVLPTDRTLTSAPQPYDTLVGALEFASEVETWETPQKPAGIPADHVLVRFLKQPKVGVMGAAGPVTGHMFVAGETAALPLQEFGRLHQFGEAVARPGRVLGWLADGICERVNTEDQP